MTAEREGKVHYALTVIGKDRPGIVAGTAEVLYRLGCNIEDSSCSMLGGQFAMILIVSHARPFSKSRISDEFRAVSERMGLSTFVRSLAEEESHYRAPEGELCIVSVYGSDKPGIVYHVTRQLAEREINITDLNTKLVGSDAEPVYVMIIEAALPEGMMVDDVSGMLEKLKRELSVEISVRSVTPVSL